MSVVSAVRRVGSEYESGANVQRRATLAFLLACVMGTASPQHEKLFVDAAAFDPVPSADGEHVAYVLTGRKPYVGGLGRSSVRSEVAFADITGANARDSGVEGFLGEWQPNGEAVLSYRDWRFNVVGLRGGVRSGRMPSYIEASAPPPAERVAYLTAKDAFIWVEHKNRLTILQSSRGPIATFRGMLPLSSIIVPSPDGRLLAVGGQTPYRWESHDLWVLDLESHNWVDLGPLSIHPDPDWDYAKPTWSPWFADGKQLAFFSNNGLVVASADGRSRRTILRTAHAGLASPSRDGLSVAYVSYAPRSSKFNPTREFWGGSTIWVVSLADQKISHVSGPSPGEVYDLRWLTSDVLIFDRIGESLFNEDARIWTVTVLNR